MTIGEAARAVGIAPSAIRYYEAVGILSPATRKGGVRQYDEDVIDLLKIIRFFRAAGVPIREIAMITERPPRSKARRETWTQVLRARIAAIDSWIQEGERTRLMLERAIGCDCDDKRDKCVILQAAD